MKLFGKLVVGFVLLVIGFVIACLVWSVVFADDTYQEAMYESGMEKALVDDFRQYFFQRQTYEAMSFEELHKKGILTDPCYDYIKSGFYSYTPFSPGTSEDDVVLRLGPPLLGEYFYKRDMIADPNGPDTIEKK